MVVVFLLLGIPQERLTLYENRGKIQMSYKVYLCNSHTAQVIEKNRTPL